MITIPKAIKNAFLGVIGTALAFGTYQGILRAGDARWVQQSAVDRQTISTLLDRRSDLKWSLEHDKLDPMTRGRKQNQLETVNKNLQRYGVNPKELQ